MSLFGAIDTAISGLGAQSSAFGNISDNVANSQTTGFKRVDTSFEDYLTTSTVTENQPGAVVAKPDYINSVQGSVTQTDNPLALAIAGQGFFAVSQATGSTGGAPTFNPQQFYTRDGNFSMNASGYLVNDSGQYLNGWSVNPSTGAVNQNAVAPIQVTQTGYNPVATSNVTLSANLPATPSSGTATSASPLSSQITVYDSLGTAHTVNLNWAQVTDASGKATPNSWNVKINVPDGKADTAGTSNANPTDVGTADVTFGANGVPEGTIGNVAADSADAGTVTSGGYAAGQPATLKFTTNFGSGDQTIQLNLGTYGSATGVTQYAGTAYNLLGLTQDGVPPGSFSGVTTQANGDVQVNYNNGQTRTIAQVPLVTFNAPDSLQRQNGQATGPAGFSNLISRVINYAFGSQVQSGVAQPAFNTTTLGPGGTLTAPFNSASSLSNYATSLVASQAQQSATTTSNLTSEQALQTSLTSKVAAVSGVSMDTEMSMMISLQNAYGVNARIMSAVQSMFTQILQAVQ